MDVLAVASVIVAGVAAASNGINAFYNTRRTARTAKEARAEQRAADGYLKILSLVEQEAQWLDSRVHNLGLDQKELEYGVVSFMQIPKPAVTDRAIVTDPADTRSTRMTRALSDAALTGKRTGSSSARRSY